MSLFKFGVVADLQYGSFSDRTNYYGDRKRYYKNSLEILKRAVDAWNIENVDFVVQMGDLIDGFNAFEFNSSQAAHTDVIASIREKLPTVPLFHVIGNHELYNFARNDLDVAFPIPDAYSCLTYTLRNSRACCFRPSPGILFVIVDNYEFSMLGYPEHDIYYAAKNLLMVSNHNHHELNSPEGLDGLARRFCQYNGTMTTEQISWLDEILEDADKVGDYVIIAGHLPIEPRACSAGCLDWRYDECLSLIRRHPSVVAYFAGHNHDGGYVCDENCIHHITFQGAIETPPGTDCFATITVYSDYFEICGRGRIPSRTCLFRKR